MASFEFLAVIISILGLAASITYYAIILKNQNETRQAQLFMDLYETARSQEFRRKYYALTMQQKWDNYMEYLDKYGPSSNIDAFSDHGALCEYFDGVGVLLKKGLVDLEMVEELLFPMIVRAWEKLGPVILEARKIDDARSELYKNFEYLYNEVNR